MSLAAASSSPALSPPDEPSLAPPLPDLLRSDSVGASRLTSGLTLHRVLEIHFPMLSRFMFEAELYPLLILSKSINGQIRKEIAHAQSQERLKWHRMRLEIEEQLACIKQIRSHLSASEQNALDVEATACCLQLISSESLYTGDFSGPVGARCRSLIERGGRIQTPDHELTSNISDLVRVLISLVETQEPVRSKSMRPDESAMPPAERELCSSLVEFLKLCFLSNPLLWRNKQYVGNGGYTLLEMLLETPLSRFNFSYGPRTHFRLAAARATAEFLGWLIQLLLLQPAFLWYEWRHMDQHLLELCMKQLSTRHCITSEQMLVTPRQAYEIAELKQLRWSIIRQCAGGPDAHSFSSLALRLNAPSLPSFHPHPLVFLRWSSDLAPDPASMCPACGLNCDDASNVWLCAQCNFRMHCECVVRSREAQESGFKARTASEVQRMLQLNTPEPTPIESIPASVLDELRYTFDRLFGDMSSVGAFGLMSLLLESSPSFCLSMQTALKLGPLPPGHRSSKSMVQKWLDGWMKDSKAKVRLLALLTGRSRFRSVVLLLDEPPNLAPAALDFSESSNSSSSSSGPSQSLHFPCLLVFDLIRRKERRLLSHWLKKDRAYFVAIWPTLIDPTTGCPPLLYLAADARGCRQHVFTLLARFTCEALRLKPADLLLQRNAPGQSLAEMLAGDWNRDLRGIIDMLSTGTSEDN